MNDTHELFWARHAVFVRKSREAARQSLLFLGILEKTDRASMNRALEGYAPFALQQVDALVDGVHVQEGYEAYRAQVELEGSGGDEERRRAGEAIALAE